MPGARQSPLAVEIRTMARVVSESVAPRRFQAALVGWFAFLALGLACVGIYGVVAYGVIQRRAEIGVRLALGATPNEIFALMLRRGMAPVIGGMGVGLL